MPLTALRPTLLGAFTPALALLLGLSPHGVQALGLARPQIHSALGSPLDASIPLLLAEGEQLSDGCVRAEVSAGDARVPAGLLQMRIEGEPGQQRIRLQSLARIDEPALRVTLALGCPLRLTREFNVFVDPPAGATPASAPPPMPLPVAALPVVEPTARLVAQAAPAPPPRPRVRARPRAEGSRLTLDRPEVLVAEAPRPAPAEARAAEMELTPELEAQIAQLEQTVAQLRAELQARHAEAASAVPVAAPAASQPPPTLAPVVRSGRASPYRDPMTWLLTLGLSLMAGAAAFYGSGWRERRARRERAYWQALHAAQGAHMPASLPASSLSPAPSVPPSPGIAPAVYGAAALLPDEGQHQATRPQPRPLMSRPTAAAPPVPVASPLSMQATQPMPVHAATAPVLSDELTVADELLDLQQQVEFLLLLGQHEAAEDLLATRLARGHTGAMPYLMAMALNQQRGEAEPFAERARQFEQRFDVPAPPWSQSLARAPGLEACTRVIAHLQVVWPDPAATMQMLRELLARGAGPGVSRFELPAYRDLLTLYGIARDLFEAGLRSDDVDVVLDSSFGEPQP